MGKIVNAAGIQINQTSCQRAFADGFHDESASKIMAFRDPTRDDMVLTP